jgi:branched-chain amino acid transport system substrate-binding protein
MKVEVVAKSLLAGAAMFLASAGIASAQLKVAVIENLSGPGSATNRLFAVGMKTGLAMVNQAGGWKGQAIEYLEYDSQGSSSVAADKTRAAISDGAHILVSGGSSAVAGQIVEDVRKHNLRNPDRRIIFMNVGAEASDFTGEKCNFYSFKYAMNAEIRVKALVTAMKAAGALGDRVFSINQNYSWGKDMEAAIVRYAGPMGYTVVDKVLHDVSKIQDFSPYVARIKSSNASTVITGNWGSDLILLVKEIGATGLKVQLGSTFLELPGTLSSAGSSTLGYYTADFYIPEAGGAAAKELFERYKALAGTLPTTSEVKSVMLAQMLQAALASVERGPKIDPTQIALALEKAKIQTPIGEMSMRAADHQASVPLVVSIVSKDAAFKVDGTDMGFKPVKVIPGPEAISPVQDSCKMDRPS